MEAIASQDSSGDSSGITGNYSIPMNRVGHKGLFMDRLDVSAADPGTYADNPRLAPFATALYQNRNRTYSPQLGRFIQRDPNQSGQLLAAMQEYHGNGASGHHASFALEGMYGDGGSASTYLRAAPLSGCDPHGLSDLSLAGQMAMMANDAWDTAEETFETAKQGLRTSFSLGGMLAGYRASSDIDLDWAMDMAAPDTEYDRSGIYRSAYEAQYTEDESSAIMIAKIGGKPDILPVKRQHGNLNHWRAQKDQLRKAYEKFNGKRGNPSIRPNSVRTNQSLVDDKGEIISTSRPDLQFQTDKGHFHITEVVDSQPISAAKAKHAEYSRAFRTRLGMIGTFHIVDKNGRLIEERKLP